MLAQPVMMFKCRCRDCQQVTGDGLVPGLLVPVSAFRFTKGPLRYHFTPSLDGGPQARFLARMRVAADWRRIR